MDVAVAPAHWASVPMFMMNYCILKPTVVISFVSAKMLIQKTLASSEQFQL